MDNYKTCTICGLLKNEGTDFYRSKDGYENQCKDCRNLSKYKARIEKREKLGLRTRTIGNRQSRILKEQGLHYCCRCQIIKPVAEFSTMNVRGGIATHCKLCCREISDERSLRDDVKETRHNYYNARKRKYRNTILKREFGITIDDYEDMLQQQNNVCAICGGVNKTKSLCVDHSHITGKVRGLLCNNCNVAIGMLAEDPVILNKAIEYINKWR